MRLKNTEETQRSLAEYKSVELQLDKAVARKPHVSSGRGYPDFKKAPRKLSNVRTLKLGNGSSIKIDLQAIELETINKLIESKEGEESEKKNSIDQLKARAAETENDTRQQARQYQNEFTNQRRIVPECPYCGGALNKSGSHHDHIYPVSRGGRSTKENLVFVCVRCNLRKSDQTLGVFLDSEGFDKEVVYGRLKTLNKDF